MRRRPMNSQRAILLYGPPGAGKTFLCEHMARLLTGHVAVPHAIEVDGEIIKLFDTTLHQPKEADTGLRPTYDRRWTEIERPTVVAAPSSRAPAWRATPCGPPSGCAGC